MAYNDDYEDPFSGGRRPRGGGDYEGFETDYNDTTLPDAEEDYTSYVREEARRRQHVQQMAESAKKRGDSVQHLAKANWFYNHPEVRALKAFGRNASEKLLPNHGWYFFWLSLSVVALLGGFISSLAVPLSTHGNWWWRTHWSVDGYQELSKRYEIVTIVMPLGLGISFLSYLFYLTMSHIWARVRFYYYRDGIDYILLFDTIVSGISYTWLVTSLCGLTNINELLFAAMAYMTGHALLSISEYYGYNNLMTAGQTGSGRMAWFTAFLTHSTFFVLLPLNFSNGTRHHSTAAFMVLYFYLANIFVHHVASFMIVFYHSYVSSDSTDPKLAISRGGIFTYFRKPTMFVKATDRTTGKEVLKEVQVDDVSKLNDEAKRAFEIQALNWAKHINCIETWNCIRLMANSACRLTIVISILAGDVFRKRGEVVF